MESRKLLKNMVGARGIEPLTSSASRKRSPTELRAYKVNKIIFYNPPCQSHDLLYHINKKLQDYTPQYDDITLVVMEKT